MNNTISDNLMSSTQPSFISNSNQETSLFSIYNWKMWLIIILVLAFFGINIFVYLAKGTQDVSNLLKPITGLFAGLFGKTANTLVDTTKETVNLSASGAKGVIDVAAGTVTTGLTAAQSEVTHLSNNSLNDSNSLTNALNNSQPNKENDEHPTYQSDDSYSSIQSSKTSGKAGWCFIGEDRGFRSCIQVGENDTCMSGDIFRSQDVCVNPNLRH